MAITEAYTGTESVTTTEHYLTTDTTSVSAITAAGAYQLFLDVSDMVAGDILQIRMYEKCRSGDTQRCCAEWILREVQSCPIWVSPTVILMNGWDMSLDCIAGTSITVQWSIRKAA